MVCTHPPFMTHRHEGRGKNEPLCFVRDTLYHSPAMFDPSGSRTEKRGVVKNGVGKKLKTHIRVFSQKRGRESKTLVSDWCFFLRFFGGRKKWPFLSLNMLCQCNNLSGTYFRNPWEVGTKDWRNFICLCKEGGNARGISKARGFVWNRFLRSKKKTAVVKQCRVFGLRNISEMIPVLNLSCPPTSQTVNLMFLYSTYGGEDKKNNCVQREPFRRWSQLLGQ